MFVRNCWYVAAWDYEIPVGQPVGRQLLNEPIVLYRDSRGAVVALADRCSHRFAPLSAGRIEGDDIRCLYHGLKFCSTGRCLEIPNQDLVPERANIRSYPVLEQDSWIWVWMGEEEKADKALVPRAVGLDHPDWVMKSGQRDFAANWELLNDNLCDLTHLAYVHRETLGRGAPGWGKTPMVTRRLPRGIQLERWVPDCDVGDPDGVAAKADQWAINDFLAPGIFLIENHYYAAGTAVQMDFKAPRDLQPAEAYYSSQAVTPISEKQTRYFYSIGPSQRTASPERLEQAFALIEAAFEEDRLMEEAQQRIIDLSPDHQMLTIWTDQALNTMRKIMRDIDADGLRSARAEMA